MAKKGRPFTYQEGDEKPVTISMRLPKALHTRLERYAKQHRQSVSELVRDGIEMRLETDADPRSRKAGSTAASPQEDEPYYGNTEDSTALLDGASILREMREGFAQIRAMVQTLEPQARPGSNGAYYGNTATAPEAQQSPASQEPGGSEQDTVAAYDTSKHHLGKLCPRGHDHEGSGQSLRNTDNQCLKCKAEDKRAKDARKRQAQAATP